MSEWIVYSKDGLTERCRLKRLEYNGSFMNERTISATFEYHSEVAFDVFDYIVYRNEKFELESIPSVKKISNHNYEYELRFVSLKYELERCEMRDIVPKDNGVTYPTPLTFSFTGDVRYLTERIQANLDSLYGEGVWSIVIPEGVKSEEKNITISQQNCWNALSLVNTTYNLTFSIKGRVITVGGEQSLVGHVFQYGKGKGLYEIERVSDTDTGIVTKVRAYGGTRNLDYSYPKRPEWTDSVLPVSFALSPLRLMLPSFKLDGKTDYVLADDSIISEYGIREASVVYDDIYPSITGMLNYDDEPIDEIKSVDEVDDSKDTFIVYLYDLGFDLESNLTTENAQISMKSGSLIGYTFNISEIEKQEDNSYKITLGRITNEEGDTGNFNIPNSQWSIAAGDKFVLLNILMPQEYIRHAEERLLERAKEYLNEYGRTNFSYNVGLHDKFLKENANIYEELIEGSKLRIYDQNLGISEDVTIQSITITENMGDNMLTQVKVTLNNKPSASTIERIQGQIKELSETSAGQFSTQSELLKQYRRKLDKPFFDRLFAAVDINGNEIPSTDLSTPIAYIKARYSVASIGGFTMYLNDNSYNLPSIYDGLPIDNNTIYWENGILKAKGGGGVAESVSWADITGKPEWLLDGKISYSEIEGTPDLSVYALKRSLSEYVTKTELTNLDYADKDWVKEYVVDINTGNITAITKQMVIEALGYTPYDNTNPNGYVTSESIPSLDGYATEDWVIKKGYLTSIPSEYITESELTAKGYATALSVNAALGNKVDKVDGMGLSTEDFTTALKTKLEGLNNYNDTAISNAVTKLRNDFDALVDGDTSTAIDNFNEIIAFLNGVQDNQDLSSIIASIEQQIAAKYTKPSGGIPKSDLVQAVQTSLGKADSALQSHQSIYTLTFQSGTFASGSFTANSGNKTINIPTTTSHVSEGSNLYFTNARAVSALGDTLKSYVTLSGSQTVSGEKNFTGGLKVNGSPIVYDAAKKCWKLEGDLLITGGLTMYGSDSSFTPSTIMDAIAVDGTTISKDGGVLRVIGGGSGSISEITKQMVIDALGFTPISSSDIPTALPNPHSLKFGSKLYDGSASKTILASDLGALTAHQTIYALTVKDSAGTTQLTYTPNSGTGSLTITKAMVGLGNVDNLAASGYLTALSSNTTNAVSITVGGTTKSITSATMKTSLGLGSLAYKSSLTASDIPNLDWSKITSGNPTTLSGYGITDAKIANGVVTLGSSSITPLTNITTKLVTDALGYTPYNMDDFTKANIKSTLGISDWALAASKPSYTWDDILGRPTLLSSFTDDVVAGKYLPLSGGTISGFFAINGSNASYTQYKVNNAVKGEVGWHSNYGIFIKNETSKKFLNITDEGLAKFDGNTIIHSGNIGSQSVASATKLQTARTIWGQSFDGTGNVDGVISINGLDVLYSNGVSTFYAGNKSVTSYLSGNNVQLRYGDAEATGLILNSAGNVGIGTNSPSEKLEVNGNISALRGIFGRVLVNKGYGDHVGDQTIETSSNGMMLYLQYYNNGGINLCQGGGNVGIGTTEPSEKLEVNGNAKANGFVATSPNGLRLAYGDYGALLRNDGSGLFILLTNKGDALNGSFNTLRPFKIDLATGDIQMESNVFITKSFKLSKRLRVNAKEAEVSFGYLKSNIANANNVGIAHLGTNYGGTSDMTREDLDMTAISMYRGIVGIGKEYDYTSLRAIYDAGVDLGLTKGLLIGSAKVLYTNNELNISTSAYINGNILTTGGITMYSQRSLKNIVDERGLSLNELRTIKPTRYTWKDNRDDRIHFGGIADDIQQVLPEVVYNANGVLTMDYGNAGFAIASSLIKPVVDHEQRIKALEKENEELKQEIKRLRA